MKACSGTGLFSAIFLPVLLLAQSALADNPRGLANTYRGGWADEGINCKGPAELLWFFGQRKTAYSLEAPFEPHFLCRILKVEGKAPDWNLHLSCHPSGARNQKSRQTITQIMHLHEQGRRLKVTTRIDGSSEIRINNLSSCRRYQRVRFQPVHGQ
jgi:hypothetical protein